MSDGRMEMSLDDIIAKSDAAKKNERNSGSGSGRATSGGRRRQNSSGGATRGAGGRNGGRSARAARPYEERAAAGSSSSNARRSQGSRRGNGNTDDSVQCTVKFLLSNEVTGVLIGAGGAVIRELMEITETKIQVGSHRDCFPGTDLRQVLISGTERAVMHAQNLVWNCVGHHAHYSSLGHINQAWDPSIARTKEYGGDLEVEASIGVPFDMVGKIIGRRGAALSALRAECGVNISVSDQNSEAADIERVLSFAGGIAGCRKACKTVFNTMNEADHHESAAAGPPPRRQQEDRNRDSRDQQQPEKEPQRATRSHSYSERSGLTAAVYDGGHRRDISLAPADSGRNRGGKTSAVARTLSAETTIELSVADSLVGSIIGAHGAALSEIISLSGANVVVSKRGEFVAGTNNRLVTITGPPACAQTAHTLVMHRIKMQMEEDHQSGRDSHGRNSVVRLG